MKNYRTTLIGALLAGATFLGMYQSNGGDLGDWKQWFIPLLIAVLGYIAKDAGVTGMVKLALLSLLIPACSPQQRQTTLALADIGLAAAVASGKISPGDSLAIGHGIAIVTSDDSTQSKVLKLADLGLAAAAQKGIIKPGDAVLIQSASAIVTASLLPPADPPAIAGN